MITEEQFISRYIKSSLFKERNWMPLIKGVLCKSGKFQNIHTPISLTSDIINKLKEYTSLDNKSILAMFNLEFIDCLVENGVNPKDISFVSDSNQKEVSARYFYKISNFYRVQNSDKVGVNFMPEIKRKFDVIVMNPPYQDASDNKGVGHTLWNKFVKISLELLNVNGYLCAIHPAGWRRPTGSFLEIGNMIKRKQIIYLKMCSIRDGQKTFGACTNFDWYVLCNNENKTETTIIGHDEIKTKLNIRDLPCVPNGRFEDIIKLFSFSEEDKINVLRSESAYECRKKWMSENQCEEFKYPCIYSLPQKGIQLRWSKTNKNGHFGIPKVIFSNGASPKIIVDKKGEYGLTQWAFGIVDSINNLDKIKDAMGSERFVDLCKYMRFTLDKYDVNFISCLRKDFWKEFI